MTPLKYGSILDWREDLTPSFFLPNGGKEYKGALEGTAWIHGARRESECDDCDVIMGLHLFYLDALVTTEDGQFVGVGGGGVNR